MWAHSMAEATVSAIEIPTRYSHYNWQWAARSKQSQVSIEGPFLETYEVGRQLTSRFIGVMIAMSHTVTLKGAIKFSMKKLLAGGEMTVSNYTGPGEILFAPSTLGDISLLRLNGSETWNVGKDAFLAATQGVTREYKNQRISKAMFSGEGMFVYKISGSGILWISSFGAIIRKDVSGFPS